VRSADDAFHVAIPARDLDEAEGFYNRKLGCQIARRYADRVTFNFFGDQLVCHYTPNEPVRQPSLYPRHFGITFREAERFDALLRLIEIRKIPVHENAQVRFEGTVEEHRTVVLQDPTGNMLEFKQYVDERMIY
jgi:uncharacterized protein